MSNCLLSSFTTICSVILQGMLVSEIGRKLLGSLGPPLCIGMMLDTLQSYGT